MGGIWERSLISTVRPTVHTNPSRKGEEKFENAALFLRLGLPSTLIRHENAAVFLWLGLPSTLIQADNGALTKTLLKQEEFENASFLFLVWTENILKTELFENNDFAIIMWFPSVPEFF